MYIYVYRLHNKTPYADGSISVVAENNRKAEELIIKYLFDDYEKNSHKTLENFSKRVAFLPKSAEDSFINGLYATIDSQRWDYVWVLDFTAVVSEFPESPRVVSYSYHDG